MLGFRLRKWVLERMLLLGLGFEPNYRIIRVKSFLQALDNSFKVWESLENDYRMKLRVRALRNVVMWLCSTDGAYLWRAERFYKILRWLKDGA